MNLAPTISVLKLHPNAQLPSYSHTGPHGDLAADLHAVADLKILPGETVAVPIGLALGLPEGYGALVEDRSGLALKGISTLAGVIDPGYRGEIKVILTNLSLLPFTVTCGARVAQLRIVQRIQAEFTSVEALDDTHRGADGFGSTGV